MRVRQEIQCSLCQKARPDLDRINRGINDGKTVAEKVFHARELLQKVEAVLKEHEHVDSGLAEVCRAVLNLRKKTAELILKLEK